MHAVWRHLLVGAASGAFAWLVVVFPPGNIVEPRLYDLFLTASSPRNAPADIVIVAIDEPSFAELGLQWPWPRRLHAQLIDTLKAGGAATIAFDVIFAEPSTAEDDQLLAEAIEYAGNVVLASTRQSLDDPRFSGEMTIEPLDRFTMHARVGLAVLPLDPDFVVRALPEHDPEEPLLAEAILGPGTFRAGGRGDGAGIAYRGPAGTFNTVSYYQALDAARFLPPRFFEGKTVLVGRAVGPSPEPTRSAPDVFATPLLFGRSSGPMSGVEIHANLVAGLRADRFIKMAPHWLAPVIALLAGLAGSALSWHWRPWRSGFLALGLAAAAGIASYEAFARVHWWISPLPASIAAAAPYGGFALHAYLVSERKRRDIRRVFSHYLSPAVLEEVLRNPDALRLGGRTAEVTLLFSDLEGFTSISHSLAPEQVGRFLNRIFTEMTRIVFAHRGTVDKFVGDALIAFWGAPLDDPRHTLNASRAALAMQARMAALREEMRLEGLPELRMRIGIHTGEAIVGNMGSTELFNYTALGDSVNLASRLEGANKQFGTSILVSAAVVAAAGGQLVTRALGPLQVRGRGTAVEVYELQGLAVKPEPAGPA